MSNKLISVCIPIYNGEEYIEKTLISVINQTYKNIEIIISDNCSTDNSVEIIEKWIKKDKRIRLNRNKENLGYSGNLNKLIKLANSEYIAIYHADDIYESTIIEEQVKFLDENQELAGCFTLGKWINEKDKIIKNKFILKAKNKDESMILNIEDFIRIMCSKGNPLICPTSMIKKTVYIELNGYDEKLKYIEDLDMWIRILEKYNLGIIKKDLLNYRVHSNQVSSYYSNKGRSEIAVDLSYIAEYLKANKGRRNNILNLDKRISRSFLVLARNALYSQDKVGYIKNIKYSKKKCLLKKDLLFLGLQVIDPRITYYFLKNLLYIYRKFGI